MHQSLEKEKSGTDSSQVHDELILDTPEKEIDKVVNLTTEAMMGAAQRCTIEIDIGIGDNWDQAH